MCSLTFFLITGNDVDPKIFLFPAKELSRDTGEIRYIPKQSTEEERVEKYVQELILGPSNMNLSRLVPENTTLRSVLLRNGTLYLDFSEEILFQGVDTPLQFEETLSLLEKTVMKNFRGIKKIYITIKGQLPENWDDEDGNKKNKSR